MKMHYGRAAMGWDGLAEVTSPRGVMLETILEAPDRRQDMRGFDPEYLDFVDYILRCTHRIWEQRNIGLCRTHYAPDVVMHTLTGHHLGLGPWGVPSGRELLILAESHYRVEQGVITEDVTVFDELAVLRQVAGGLGA